MSIGIMTTLFINGSPVLNMLHNTLQINGNIGEERVRGNWGWRDEKIVFLVSISIITENATHMLMLPTHILFFLYILLLNISFLDI